MRRGNLFWGLILILLGGLFLLKAIGLISDVLGWFWPIGLILLGIWVLGERILPRGSVSGETFSIELKSAARLDLDIEHGAGSLFLNAGAPAGVAVCGSSGATLEVRDRLNGENLGVELKAGPSFLPFLGPDGGEWQFQLTREIPVAIKLESGASSLDLDMSDVKLTFLGIEAGASSIKVKLPAQAVYTLVDIEAGAASLDLFIPTDVGARIRIEQGVSSLDIDEKRFARVTSMQKMFESQGYETAANKVEINLEAGASSLFLH